MTSPKISLTSTTIVSQLAASCPVEQGLDPNLVAELYDNASERETLFGLLVIKKWSSDR